MNGEHDTSDVRSGPTTIPHGTPPLPNGLPFTDLGMSRSGSSVLESDGEASSATSHSNEVNSESQHTVSTSPRAHTRLISGGLPELDYRIHTLPREMPRRSSTHPIDLPTMNRKCSEDPITDQQRTTDVESQEWKDHCGRQLDRFERMLMSYKKDNLWSTSEGFKATKELKKFYFLANQILMCGGEISVCLLCTCSKESNRLNATSSAAPNSHVFPKSLLDTYYQIHHRIDDSKRNKKSFYDSSRDKVLSPKTLAHPLFCSICENKAHDEERKLKNVYLHLMVLNESDIPKIKENSSHELRHVLAILMFRGALLGINFWEESLRGCYNDFFQLFIKLRDYCLLDDIMIYKNDIMSEKIHLFLLPNCHFNPFNRDPRDILDCQLRNPQFTTMTIINRKPCLYMKFDCFHCVLPVTGTGINFLSKLGSDSCFTNFYPPKSGEDEGYFRLLPLRDAINHFPKPLVEYNLSQIESLHYSLSAASRNKYGSDVVGTVPMFKVIKPVEPHYPIQEQESQDIARGEVFLNECIGKTKELIQKVIQKAREASPLKDCPIELLIAQREKQTNTSEMLQERVEALQKETETANDKWTEIKVKNEELERKNEELEKENEQLKNKLGQLVSRPSTVEYEVNTQSFPSSLDP